MKILTKKKEKDLRLDQTKKVLETLEYIIKTGSVSYRDLIYDKLGFWGNYSELIAGLTVTNAIVELEKNKKVINEILDYAFLDYCPYEAFADEEQDVCEKAKKICDCENCSDNYKECWLKYFEYKSEENDNND